MSVTWTGPSQPSKSSKEYSVLEVNQRFEQECWEQAKAELDGVCKSPIEWTVRVVKRAQEIKMERRMAEARRQREAI